MVRPSDGIILTINFIPSVNLFCKYTGVLIFFCRYSQAFYLDLFGSVLVPNNSTDSVTAVYLSFLDDMLNVPEDGYDWGRQYSLACTSTSLGHVWNRQTA
jgi:hypothetical protein